MHLPDLSELNRSLGYMLSEAKLYVAFCEGELPFGACPSCGRGLPEAFRRCEGCGFELRPACVAIRPTEWGYVVTPSAEPQRILRRFELGRMPDARGDHF